jgi:hypothetical protein
MGIIALARHYRLMSVRRCIRKLRRYRSMIRRYRYFEHFLGHRRRLPFNRINISLFDLEGLEHYHTFRLYPDILRNFSRLFEKDQVFISRRSKPQAPPLYQLGLLLNRLAHQTDVRQLSFLFRVSSTSSFSSLCSSL